MLRKQLQLLDDYFWLKIKYSSKYKLLMLILVALVLSAIVITFVSISNWFIPNFSNIFTPKLEVASAVASLYIKNADAIKFVPITDENTCYYISPDYVGDSYVIAIEKTLSTTHDCYGDVIKKSYIPVDRPVSINGNSSCFCGNKVVELKKLLSDEDLSIEVIK